MLVGLSIIRLCHHKLALAGPMVRFVGTVEVVVNGVLATTADGSKHRELVRGRPNTHRKEEKKKAAKECEEMTCEMLLKSSAFKLFHCC